jgi:hypothetical protein
MTEQPIRWQIFTGANPTVERIIPKLAVEIGLNESIMLMQIAFWINGSTHIREGVYWTYHSIREMHKNYFPYWSTATIHRTIVNLKEQGYILTGEFNKRKNDHTQWFALEPDKLSTLKSVLIAPALSSFEGKPFQNETPLFQNETALPKTPTNIKKKTIAPSGAAQGDSKPKTERPRNPIFDAVALGSFQLANVNGDKTLGARIGKIVAWLKDQEGVTAERIAQFYTWYSNENPRASAPKDPSKFAEWWAKFAAQGSGEENPYAKMFETMDVIGGKPWENQE